MLRQLHISGLGVIDDIEIELHPGLNVLTGETGAGKTMIVVGLALALGGRASAALVREGHPAARVQALFDALGPSDGWAEDGEVVLARSVTRDGRSTARIGGQLATASALAEVGATLVEVHGQHQGQKLLTSPAQTSFLDRSTGEHHLLSLASYREAYRGWRRAVAEFDELREAVRDRERELDLLTYQIREIDAADPRDGESEQLEHEEARLAHAERLTELSATALGAVADDGGAIDRLAAAASNADAAAALDPAAAEIASRLRSLTVEAGELAHDLRSYEGGLDVNPQRLQEVRERRALLNGLQRKYGATDAEVRRFRDDAEIRARGLEGSEARLVALQGEVERQDRLVRGRSEVVSAGRVSASIDLARAVTAEVQELGMPDARFEVGLDALSDLSTDGAEAASFALSPGPGQPLLPIAKCASGGELSRTMLALRSVLADADDVPTIVFDEVDTGVGGRTGMAVGRRLARLAAERQVVVVSHLPQIACFADLHARVTKHDGIAELRVLDDQERVEELSRMLAGSPGSGGASSHARELLDEASLLRGQLVR